MNDFKGLYIIRDGIKSDCNFILSTFLIGLYYGNDWFNFIPKNIFMASYKIIAKNLIENPKVIIKVACLPDDLNTILGYSILSYDYKIVHWVYVKAGKLSAPWRKKGIGKSLIPERPVSVSHLSNIGKKILLNKYKETVFDPFSI